MQDINDQSTPMLAKGQNDTDKIVQRHELGRVIENALGRIPFDYRMVFSLREINGLNVAETAETLHISNTNVKVCLNRAKAMLRSEIKKDYAPSELFEFNLIYCNSMVENVMKKIRDL